MNKPRYCSPGDQFRYGNITLELVRRLDTQETINGRVLNNMKWNLWISKIAGEGVLCDVSVIESNQWLMPPREPLTPEEHRKREFEKLLTYQSGEPLPAIELPPPAKANQDGSSNTPPATD